MLRTITAKKQTNAGPASSNSPANQWQALQRYKLS
jgi:hypothetical protein